MWLNLIKASQDWVEKNGKVWFEWPKFTIYFFPLLVSIFYFDVCKIFSFSLIALDFRRSIIPPNMSNKPRNGPISPRDHRERDYNHQPSHYSNSYNNSTVNHHHSSHNSHHQNSSQQSHHHHSHHQSAPPPPQQQQSYHPNSDLIHFVSSAWKEKVHILNAYNVIFVSNLCF